MRVLFTTTGHSGHLLPLVPLARACERAGHEVLVVTHEPRAAAVARVGLPVRAVAVAPDEAWAPLMSRIRGLAQSDADALIIAEGFARIGGGGALPGFLDAVETWRPDLLVHECYEFAGPIAAERHGVRIARVALGLASTEDWVTELAAPALPAWWDDADAPLVYLTLGSVTGSLPFFPALYDRMLGALAALPVRVLLTIGRDGDRSALDPLPGNAHVEAWVAQHEVLPHAAAVVSHAGYGTTLGALEHGVPLVMLPLFAGDQWRTARRVEQVGAGVVLQDGERRVFDPPSDDVIAMLPEAVQRALRGRGLRRTAQRLGREMAALPSADAAAAALLG